MAGMRLELPGEPLTGVSKTCKCTVAAPDQFEQCEECEERQSFEDWQEGQDADSDKH